MIYQRTQNIIGIGTHENITRLKWITFEDVSGDGMDQDVKRTCVYGAFFRGLYEKLVTVNSPDAMLWASFDDEMPNFVGVFGLGPNDYDYEEYIRRRL